MLGTTGLGKKIPYEELVVVFGGPCEGLNVDFDAG